MGVSVWGIVPLRILGLYWDSGKENGNYDLGFRVYSPL